MGPSCYNSERESIESLTNHKILINILLLQIRQTHKRVEPIVGSGIPALGALRAHAPLSPGEFTCAQRGAVTCPGSLSSQGRFDLNSQETSLSPGRFLDLATISEWAGAGEGGALSCFKVGQVRNPRLGASQ